MNKNRIYCASIVRASYVHSISIASPGVCSDDASANRGKPHVDFEWPFGDPSAGQGPFCWAFQCLLQIARTSVLIRGGLARPSRTAVYGPVRTVVWQGSGGQPPPLCRSNEVPGEVVLVRV